MFTIDNDYRKKKDSELFDTYEEALASAEDTASKCLDEDDWFYVTEIKAVVHPIPNRVPIKTTNVEGINRTFLLSGGSDEETECEVIGTCTPV